MKNSGVLLQVAHLGDPVLRKKAAAVLSIKSSQVQALIDDLIATVMEVDGVGIAAPQVYQSQRLFILASHPNPRYPKAPYMKPTAIINPQIVFQSKAVAKDWEGCLSIPGLRALVPRSKEIKVRYNDRTGRLVQKKFNDFVARIFQHEFDHINGILFVDRVEDSKDFISEKEYQRMMKASAKKSKKH